VRVSELPADKRPRERLERLGAKALTSAELLAILLRTGSAREDVLHLASRLLQEQGGGLRGLPGADLPTLAAIHGLGGAKATTIAAAFELGRRLALESGEKRPTVTSPQDIALTEALVEAATLLNIDVLDHIVFGHGRYVSTREQHISFD
jgi:DNA repair protein RadC